MAIPFAVVPSFAQAHCMVTLEIEPVPFVLGRDRPVAMSIAPNLGFDCADTVLEILRHDVSGRAWPKSPRRRPIDEKRAKLRERASPREPLTDGAFGGFPPTFRENFVSDFEVFGSVGHEWPVRGPTLTESNM